jgi:hypothetical protein
MDDGLPITNLPTYQETFNDIPPVDPEVAARQKRMTIIAILVAILLLVSILASIIFLLNQDFITVAHIRDIFIIFLALESMLVGLVLIVLVIQIARLTNLLQNEIKPILQSTNETISNLRGTTTFLSENLVEPVMKVNELSAMLTQLFVVLNFNKKPKKNIKE